MIPIDLNSGKGGGNSITL